VSGYIDRHGASSGPANSEWAVAETGAHTADGTPILLANVRSVPSSPLSDKDHRLQSLSHDGGLTWGPSWEAQDLPEPKSGCEGSLVYHPGTRKLYFSHPKPSFFPLRNRLTVWSSSNQGATWDEHAVIWPGMTGYSALTVMADERLGLFYEKEGWGGLKNPFDIARGLAWTTLGVGQVERNGDRGRTFATSPQQRIG
jgi:hypothetical protein